MKNNTYEKISSKAFEDNLMKLKNEFIDSKDFLLFLLQSLHDELNYYGNKQIVKHPKCNQSKKEEAFDFFMKVYNDTNLSILSYNFYGISMQETECLECHNILYNFQFFQIITFDLYSYKDRKFNLYRGFKDYIAKKKMTGDNQCYCQYICKKLTDSVVYSKMYYTPPYLIIFFDYGKNKKYIPKEIDFGYEIGLEDLLLKNVLIENIN